MPLVGGRVCSLGRSDHHCAIHLVGTSWDPGLWCDRQIPPCARAATYGAVQLCQYRALTSSDASVLAG
eukprot:7959299-Pyramimonas_sp.AAC.1